MCSSKASKEPHKGIATRGIIMWSNKLSKEPREGITMPRSNNTHGNKTKKTKKKKLTNYKLKLQTLQNKEIIT
jgi:hypothetical protein